MQIQIRLCVSGSVYQSDAQFNAADGNCSITVTITQLAVSLIRDKHAVTSSFSGALAQGDLHYLEPGRPSSGQRVHHRRSII